MLLKVHLFPEYCIEKSSLFGYSQQIPRSHVVTVMKLGLLLLRTLFIVVILMQLTACGNKDEEEESRPDTLTTVRPQAPDLGISDLGDIQDDEAPLTIGEFTTNPDDADGPPRVDLPSSREEIASMPGMPEKIAGSDDEPQGEAEQPPGFSGVEEEESSAEDAPRSPASTPALYSIDFTNFSGSSNSYLSSKGYEKASFFVSDIAAKKKNGYLQVGKRRDGFFGLRKKELTDLPAAHLRRIQTMKLNWASITYASDENWLDEDKRRQTIGIVVSFGGKTSAGVPYFLGFVLSKTGPIGRYFKPARYSEVGRYTTVAQPGEGQFVQNTIDLKDHFSKAFPDVEYPGVSGLAIEVDTRSMEGLGAVKSISLH